jgi:hypothetical protein
MPVIRRPFAVYGFEEGLLGSSGDATRAELSA